MHSFFTFWKYHLGSQPRMEVLHTRTHSIGYPESNCQLHSHELSFPPFLVPNSQEFHTWCVSCFSTVPTTQNLQSSDDPEKEKEFNTLLIFIHEAFHLTNNQAISHPIIFAIYNRLQLLTNEGIKVFIVAVSTLKSENYLFTLENVCLDNYSVQWFTMREFVHKEKQYMH